MNKTEVIEKVKALVKFYNSKFDTDFEAPKIEFHANSKSAGLCWRHIDKVSFNTDIMTEVGHKFVDTIIHEMAHFFTFKLYPSAKQHHGPEFRAVAKLAGGSGSTRTSYIVSEEIIAKGRTKKSGRYEYTCKCARVHVVSTRKHNLMQKRPYKCNTCRTRPLFSGKSWTV